MATAMVIIMDNQTLTLTLLSQLAAVTVSASLSPNMHLLGIWQIYFVSVVCYSVFLTLTLAPTLALSQFYLVKFSFLCCGFYKRRSFCLILFLY